MTSVIRSPGAIVATFAPLCARTSLTCMASLPRRTSSYRRSQPNAVSAIRPVFAGISASSRPAASASGLESVPDRDHLDLRLAGLDGRIGVREDPAAGDQPNTSTLDLRAPQG